MTRAAAAIVLLAAVGAAAVEPETCLVAPGAEPAATVEYDGRTFLLASHECRELFLSDPERYAQLFDALAELYPASGPPPAVEPVSLVPN